VRVSPTTSVRHFGTKEQTLEANDFDLELLDARTFDGHTKVLTYRPTRHG
jgi:hypothetical protein